MKILDCTLRDGGYYTNWDFDRKLVNTYIEACNALPIDYLEVGYRSITLEGYSGEYFYLPLYVMERLKAKSNKKLVVILNEKDIKPEHVFKLLSPCLGLINLVRLAIDPKQFGRALKLAAAVKAMGFEVGFNVMYMSKWQEQKDFLKLLTEIRGIADYFYMVDSYGGVYPQDVKNTIKLVKSYVNDVPLGFHGHNNMELALINTLTAIEEGCEIVDATITGMGRGAGNLKTELLLTALNAQNKIDVDFNPLSKVVDSFSKLQKSYEWGTNLPYMVSGAHSLPQKDVMDWVGKRYYSFNSIIRALQNQAKGEEDNTKLNLVPSKSFTKALLVGGGSSVGEHTEALIKFLSMNQDMLILHASSKNALSFSDLLNDQVFCLVGNEGHRMEEIFNKQIPRNSTCILPSYPRKMGTYIPENLKINSFELSNSTLFDPYSDSHTAIALQTLLSYNVKEVIVIGYDGYNSGVSDSKSMELFQENKFMFDIVKRNNLFDMKTITPSAYGLNQVSIYSFL